MTSPAAPANWSDASGSGSVVSRTDLACLLAVALVMSGWALRTDGELTVRRVAALAVVALASLVWGRVLLLAAGLARHVERDFGLSYLAGNLATALATMFLRLNGTWSVSRIVLAELVLGLVLWACWRRKLAAWEPRRRSQAWDFVATLVSLLAASFWLSHLYPQVIARPNAWIYRPYMENFAHAFGSGLYLTARPHQQLGSPFFAGEALHLYHYASYVWPAWIAEAGQSTRLEVLASFWFPQVLFLIGLASHQLGRLWFGPAVGVWCASIVAFPDPTYWADDISSFSWHRYVEASPSFGYSVTAAFLALVLVTHGRRFDSSRLIFAGLITAYAGALYKFNIVVAVLPAVGWILLTAGRPGTRRLGGWVGIAFFLSVAVAVWGGMRMQFAPTLRLDPQFGAEFARWVMLALPGERWWETLDAAWYTPPQVRQLPGRALWLAWATLQWWLPLGVLVGAATSSRKDRRWQALGVPAVGLAMYLILGLGLHPNQNGDPFELQHRPFGWVYLLIVIATSGLIVTAFRRHGARWTSSPTLVLLGLGLPLWFGAQTRITAPPTVLAPDFVAAGRFVAQAAGPDEPVIDAQKDPWLIVGAICQRRAFVCRADDYTFAGQGALAETRRRLRRAVDQLLAESSPDDIAAWRKQYQARWLLVHPDTQLAWPPALIERHTFAAGGYRVYDLVRVVPDRSAVAAASPVDPRQPSGGAVAEPRREAEAPTSGQAR